MFAVCVFAARVALADQIVLADGTRIDASDGWELTHETVRVNGDEYPRTDVLGIDFTEEGTLNAELTDRAPGDQAWLGKRDRALMRPIDVEFVAIVPHWNGLESHWHFIVNTDDGLSSWFVSFEEGEWIAGISFGTRYSIKLSRALDDTAERIEGYLDARQWHHAIDLVEGVKLLLAGAGEEATKKLQKQIDAVEKLYKDRPREELHQAAKNADGVLLDNRHETRLMAETWLVADDQVIVDGDEHDREDVVGVMFRSTTPYAALQQYVDARKVMQQDAVLTWSNGRDFVLQCDLFARAPLGGGNAIFFVVHEGAIKPLPTAYPGYTGNFGGVVFKPKYRSLGTDAVYAATARDLQQRVDTEEWSYVFPVHNAFRILEDNGLKLGSSLKSVLDDIDDLIDDNPGLKHIGKCWLKSTDSGSVQPPWNRMVGLLNVYIGITDTEWAPEGLVLRVYWTDTNGDLRFQEWDCDLSQTEPKRDYFYRRYYSDADALGYEDTLIDPNQRMGNCERIELRLGDVVIASHSPMGAGKDMDWETATVGEDWVLKSRTGRDTNWFITGER